MQNIQRIVNLWVRSKKAGEGEMRVLTLPYLAWALHSTSSRCFSASANYKRTQSFHLGLRFIGRDWDFKQLMDNRFPVSSLWFPLSLLLCFRLIGICPLALPTFSLLFCCFLSYNLVEDSCRYLMGISTKHQTKDWCRQPYLTNYPWCENFRLVLTAVHTR